MYFRRQNGEVESSPCHNCRRNDALRTLRLAFERGADAQIVERMEKREWQRERMELACVVPKQALSGRRFQRVGFGAALRSAVRTDGAAVALAVGL
jgi:hypothetical protein